MDKRRIVGDVVSLLLAAFMAYVTLRLSIRYLAPPHGLLDWSVQLCGAATVGIIIFFLCWGHFQKPPTPTVKDPAESTHSPAATETSPQPPKPTGTA